MLLNFDDFEYPEHVLEHFNQAKKDDDEFTQHQSVFAVGYDPNIKEFSGTKAIPA
jgi:hypothetical protein